MEKNGEISFKQIHLGKGYVILTGGEFAGLQEWLFCVSQKRYEIFKVYIMEYPSMPRHSMYDLFTYIRIHLGSLGFGPKKRGK